MSEFLSPIRTRVDESTNGADDTSRRSREARALGDKRSTVHGIRG